MYIQLIVSKKRAVKVKQCNSFSPTFKKAAVFSHSVISWLAGHALYWILHCDWLSLRKLSWISNASQTRTDCSSTVGLQCDYYDLTWRINKTVSPRSVAKTRGGYDITKDCTTLKHFWVRPCVMWPLIAVYLDLAPEVEWRLLESLGTFTFLICYKMVLG